MTRDETARLLAYVAHVDGRTVDDAVVDAWHDTISGVELEDAHGAVRQHFQTSVVLLTPHHVVTGARRIEAERIEATAHRKEDDEKIACGRKDCPCTHTAPCAGGWIDRDTGGLYESTRPCRVCRPEVAEIVRGADTHDNRMRIGQALRERGKAKW